MSDRMYVLDVEDLDHKRDQRYRTGDGYDRLGAADLKFSAFVQAFVQYFDDSHSFYLWFHDLAELHEHETGSSAPQSHYFSVEACEKMVDLINGEMRTIDLDTDDEDLIKSYAHWLGDRDAARRILELAVTYEKMLLLQGDELAIALDKIEKEKKKQ